MATAPASPIDLRSVRYLLAIVEEGSMAAAAGRLSVTQSALTRSVQALERVVGTRLLDRGRSGAEPTAAGRLLCERGRLLLSEAHLLARDLEALSGAEAGEVRIAAGAYPADISVGPAVARLVARRPALRVRVAVDDWPGITAKVIAGEVDLGVCELTAAEKESRLAIEPLPPHQGVLFCRTGHPLTRLRRVSLDDVRAFPLAINAVPQRLASLLSDPGDPGASMLAPAIQVDTFGLVRGVVADSDAVGAATRAQIDDDPRLGSVVVLPLELPWLSTRYGFLYRAGRTLSPATLAFMDELRAVEAALASVGRRRDG